MNLLVIRFSSAGDIILTSLFVRCLRARFPEATIHYATKREFAPLVEHAPAIDRVFALEPNAGARDVLRMKRAMTEAIGGRYDVVFDLHNSLRSRLLRMGLGRSLATFRKPTLAKWLLVHRKINRLRPIVPIAERYLATAERFGVLNDGNGLELHIGATPSPIQRLADRPAVALCPGARHFTKQWPAERFAEAGRRLAEAHNARIVLLGSPAERALCEEIAGAIGGDAINLAGRTDYLEAAAALDCCDVVITNDSALAHIAAARHRPVVTIFGSTVQEFGFAPYGTRSTVVEVEGLACRPCTSIGRERCPLGHFKCMLQINAGQVVEAAHLIRAEV